MTQPTISTIPDADLASVARQVLIALDTRVSWEQAAGAQALKVLMPQFRRAVDGGELDPTRCPYDDSKLEEFTDADEYGVFVGFLCADCTHTFRSVNNSGFTYPDFSEVEL